MLRNRLEVLSSLDLDRIHGHTMHVLRDVGVLFPLEEALQAFRRNGARVDGRRVYLDEDLVMKAISQAPPRFTIHARNPELDVVVGDAHHVFIPGYGAPFIMLADGTSRPGTVRDYENLARLADALPNMDMTGYLLVEPHDVPPSIAHLYMLRAGMVNSSKPFMGSSFGAEGARDSVDMAAILFGGRDHVLQHPVMISVLNTLSPLSYSTETLQALVEYARLHQPVIVAAAVQAGSSGPVTLAGTLVQHNAELLAGITLVQLLAPGTPVVYGATSTAVDMRTIGPSNGSPELSIVIACVGQMARFYKLPSRSGGCLTDSHLPDAQAGLESMMAMLVAVQSGINFVVHAGGMLSSYLTISYEKLIIDDEICGMVRRFERGIDLNEEELALDVIARVGPGGSYLMEPHTVQRCRTAFYTPGLCNRKSLNAWQQQGRQDLLQAAQVRWQEVLENHVAPLPDPDTMTALDRYVESRAGV